MDLSRFKNYRRLYPRIRLSWSLYKNWARGDYINVWKYLLGMETVKSDALQKGKVVHQYIEETNIPSKVKYILGDSFINNDISQEKKIEVNMNGYVVVGVIDLLISDYVVDWKTGSLNGYASQLKLYSWLVKKALGRKINHGLLVQIIPEWNTENWSEESKVKSIEVGRTSLYVINQELDVWGIRFEAMYDDILFNINEGYLDDFVEREIS